MFAWADTVIVCPLCPEEGETVSQDWFDDADHDDWLVDTTTPVLAASEPAHHEAKGNCRLGAGAAWTTDNVADAPPADTVTTADRDTDDVFAWADTFIVCPFCPEDGESESHVWFEDADQDD